MSRLIYCGPYYNSSAEQKIIRISKGQLNNAPNCFQSALLDGLDSIYNHELVIINALPIGSWPRHATDLILKDKEWSYKSRKAYEIGGINLPIIKQKERENRLYRYLDKIVEHGDNILLYSCYLPFMNAICRLKKKINFSIIVTDLPEFYDLGKTSFLKKTARKANNKKIYKKMEQVDSFVLLTNYMKEPLKVGNRPYTIVEGIWNSKDIKDDKALYIENKKVIFYSGTLHYQFGIQMLLDTFEQLQGNQYELWICGGGEAAVNIKELSEKDRRIKFFGFCDSNRVAELRSKASILVNPRPLDGEYTKYSFPSKTMEYLASGIPVVMFHLPGVPREYDNYLYYANEKYGGLLETIKYVVNHADEANEKAIRAREFIYKSKNSVVQANKILDLINKSSVTVI